MNALAHLAAFALALAQPTPTLPSQPTPDPFAPTTPPALPTGPQANPEANPEVNLDDVAPQIRVGLRGELLRQKQQVIPAVVIVPDAASYLAALARWTPTLRFPVLIDDGTTATRENIARFVRAFNPTQVVRWSSPEAIALDTPAQRQAAAEDALRAVWNHGTPDHPTLGDAVSAISTTPAPGIVVASDVDPAWTAALALAIGRGQPIVWAQSRQDVSDALTREEADALCTSIETALTDLELAWNTLGDTVDAVALCTNTPVRATTQTAGEWIATTDRLGRTSDQREGSVRWGWASQIHGDEPTAAYRAMCALFLTIDRAWLFDTYRDGQPWESYALRPAQEILSTEDYTPPLAMFPRNGLREWRGSIATPVDASLIMVNTHGMRNFFELLDGTAWCGDIPILNKPAAVAFIHSWSAYQPGDRNCLSGRWFERGAFAYLGSVQEPYLAAFQRPQNVAIRLASLAPWGVAGRLDGTPPWRIAVFGDPLMTLSVAQERSSDPLPLDGAEALDESMRTALRAGDFAAAVEHLVLLGQDENAGRLVSRLIADQPESITPALARVALGAMFRTARHGELQSLYARLDEGDAANPMNQDLLWLSCRVSLPAGGSVMSLLKPHIRPEQRTSDVADLALMANASGQRTAAITLLTDYRATLTDEAQIRLIDTAMRMVRGL